MGEWRIRVRDGEWRIRARDGGVENKSEGWGVENKSEGWRIRTKDGGVENKSEGWGVENKSEGWGVENKRDPQEAKVDTARNREPTAEDHVAAIKIQMYWRGYWVRYVKAARTPGTKENLHAHELLQKAWPVFEANLEQNGLLLFRNLFKLAPELMPKYSFYKDEWNKISYSDYQGNYPEQPANTWFVVFREVFHVVEDMLCMPKLYTSIPTCMLRVVNNDTGEEVPRIFQKVAPYVYKKNVHGYTFVAEARSVDQGIPPGRWRLRLIGSLSPLPTPQHGEVNAAFQTTELHDFYVPNDRNIVFRYSVKVTEDHLVSLQMATSKSDVVVRLEILDHEEVKTTATGKAHVVLPAFVFQKDPSPNTPAVNSQTGASEEETSRRSGSRMSAGRHSSVLSKVHGSGSNQVIMSKKRTGSGAHDGRGSHASTQLSVCSLEDDEEREPAKPHKYIIQAVVLRNSWPLSESQWAFVQGLKELEKAEIKVAAAPSSDLSKVSSKDHQSSPQPKSVPSKDTGTKSKDKIGKKAGGKADKEKDVKSSSRPPSQHFDLSKPNWLLRVVSDATSADDIEVKKDTERVDEIRAMKKAWEDAEPGRAAKAMQSRLQYLSTHLVKIHTEDEEGVKSDVSKSDLSRSDEKELIDVDNLQPGDDLTSPPLEISDAEPVLTLENPNPPVPKEALQDIDLTPFIRETTSHPRLLDLEELQHQLEDKQREIQEFRLYREQVEKRRDTERAERNKLKIRQLELFEEMQATLDALRAEVNEPREEFRQRLLAEEQRRQEALAAADAALRAEQERNAPSPKGKKSPKAKSAKKK
ncbi:Androglobin [Lamellibrachia satsuma]|nr:Androglobin [Lamellibrachia satsuma]